MNLLALLVDRAKPLTLRQVRQELGKQYPESDEAARAAFERDKAALRELLAVVAAGLAARKAETDDRAVALSGVGRHRVHYDDVEMVAPRSEASDQFV